ncbi:MAG: DNA polymerase III subunit gamma/tau [Clostridia bacterium]|nr:DNA polymerase III subunit gamma/tau [Clostridia bacterium]
MYQALYRKYRPLIFSDVYGQDHITYTLQSQIEKGKTAHAYLFTGSRGTGKTTCAKILSRAVNCQNPVNGNPCNQCESCREVLKGGISDVLEIDAASNNGVDNIRDIRDEVMYAPASLKKRVYIIDEVHMLSTGAFNALLKTLEEPPEHVVFILATTEVHKIPATILSRCQRYDFKRIGITDITNSLEKVCKKEGIETETEGLELIARLSDGGMRDALSILDKCCAMQEKITSQLVKRTVGIAENDYLFDVSKSVIERDSERCIELITEIHENSVDLNLFINQLITHYRNMMMVKTVTVKNVSDIVLASPDEISKYEEISKRYTLSEILSVLNILQDTMDKLYKNTDKKIQVEMCLIRLCNPKMWAVEDEIISRLNALENKIASGNITIEEKKNPPKKAPKVEEKPPVIKEEKEENKGEERLLKWAEIVKQVNDSGNKQLYSFIVKTKAMASGDILNIYTSDQFAYQILSQKKMVEKLASIVFDVTGKNYTCKIINEDKKADMTDPLEEFFENSKDDIIEIN